jgi:hypothetical protein
MVISAGTTIVISDEEFGLVTPSSLGVAWTDNGQVTDAVDLVSAQATNVPAMGALTSSAPAAVTSSQNATTNASAPGVGYVQAEAASTATLANALKVSYNAAQADIAALRATLLATQADLATVRTTLNSALAALTGTGKPMHT